MGLKSQPGVYRIRNIKNGKVYVGSSYDIRNRRNQHFRELEKNIHTNTHLQRAYNKYGRDMFSFEVLEFCKCTVLIEREQHWMDRLNSYNNKSGYNIEPCADGHKMAEQTKEKIRETQIGKDNNQSKLTDKDVREIKKELLKNHKSKTELGEDYGVAGSVIVEIDKGRVWSHVNIPDKNITYPIRDGFNKTNKTREKNSRSTLTVEKVKNIKRLLLQENKTQQEIADEFGVTQAAVSAIKTGETWENVSVEDDEDLQHAKVNSPLSVSDVREIKKMLDQGNKTQSEIARIFDVSQPTIWSIKEEKNWSSVSV